MKIPKTPKEFDYDLWTTEEGKYMVRVKATGEVTEVGREVMKALRAEEKRMRRSFAAESLDDEQVEGGNTVLSLDALSSAKMSIPSLLDISSNASSSISMFISSSSSAVKSRAVFSAMRLNTVFSMSPSISNT